MASRPETGAGGDADRSRSRMVEHTIVGRGVRDPRVVEAMQMVAREHYVSEGQRTHAYDDHPLPIGEGQTISQPYVVALMAEAARIGPDDDVLEVGTGSGYGAAVLARLARKVTTLERIPVLAAQARTHLEADGVDNVEVKVGDGTQGWAPGAPYAAIVVTAAAPAVPPALVEQLADGGRLVIPVGRRGFQRLLCLRRRGDALEEEDLGGVAFVPLIGDA